MTDKRDIRVGDRLYSRWFLEQEVGQRTLDFAYREKLPVVCLCRNIPMHIAKGRHLFLRKNPGTGPMHQSDCPSFSQDDLEDSVVDSKKPVIVRDGSLITVIAGFNHPCFADAPSSKQGDQIGVSLEHLLNLIWREAGLNLHPVKAASNLSKLSESIMAVSARIELNGAGRLHTWLHVPHAYDTNYTHHERQRAGWINKFGSGAGAGRFMVMGVVKSHTLTRKNNTLVHLKHMPTYPLICTESMNEVMDRACFDGACDVIFLCTAHKSGQYLIVEDAGILSVMKNTCLPVAHNRDLLLTRQLVAAGRRFIKPIASSGTLLDGAFLTDSEVGWRIVFTPTHQSNSLMVGADNEISLPAKK